MGNIVAVTKTLTHTAYVFDDSMGTPLEVWVWNIAGDTQPERHQIMFVIERADDCFVASLWMDSDSVICGMKAIWPSWSPPNR